MAGDRVVRRDGIAIRRPRDSLGQANVPDSVETFLSKNQGDAFTAMGLMVEIFGADPKKLNGAWSDWPEGLTTLYGRITRTLNRLEAGKKITKRRDGKAIWWVWNPAE